MFTVAVPEQFPRDILDLMYAAATRLLSLSRNGLLVILGHFVL